MSFDSEGFGHRVKTARTWQRLGVAELALALDVSDEVIYEIERGERRTQPKKLVLAALANALGQSEDWLLAGTEPPWRSQAQAGANADVMRRLADAKAALEEAEEGLRAASEGQPQSQAASR